MIGIPLGLLWANAGEWAIHKYVLHGLGRRKGTFWAFTTSTQRSRMRSTKTSIALTPTNRAPRAMKS